ncbi:hypothetical protein ES708_08097 [subsurface metagenome]
MGQLLPQGPRHAFVPEGCYLDRVRAARLFFLRRSMRRVRGGDLLIREGFFYVSISPLECVVKGKLDLLFLFNRIRGGITLNLIRCDVTPSRIRRDIHAFCDRFPYGARYAPGNLLRIALNIFSDHHPAYEGKQQNQGDDKGEESQAGSAQLEFELSGFLRHRFALVRDLSLGGSNLTCVLARKPPIILEHSGLLYQ